MLTTSYFKSSRWIITGLLAIGAVVMTVRDATYPSCPSTYATGWTNN